MPDQPDLAAELEFAKTLAVEAAAVANNRCGHVTPHEKANLTYVTDLDSDLEKMIRQRLGPTSRRRTHRRRVRGSRRRWTKKLVDRSHRRHRKLGPWAAALGH